MKPHSQRRHRHFRIKTQQKIQARHVLEQAEPNPTSLVFQSEIKSLQNYFQFLQTTFGKKVEIQKIIRNVPRSKSIHQQYDKMVVGKTQMSKQVHEPQLFQYVKMRSHTTRQLNTRQKVTSHRNSCQHSIIQMPTSQLKLKSYQSKRKKHSYLMQRMNHVPIKANSSPFNNQQFLNKDENSQFMPVGRCISKEDQRVNSTKKPRQKLSAQLMRGITYKRPHHELILIKHKSQIKHTKTEKSDEAAIQGPWKIIDTNDYNPRSFYTTYR